MFYRQLVSSFIIGIILISSVVIVNSEKIDSSTNMVKILQDTELVIVDENNQEMENVQIFQGSMYNFIKIEGDLVYIQYEGKIGYVNSDFVKLISSWSQSPTSLYFEVIVDELPIYKNVNNHLIVIGTFKKGEIYQRVKDSGKYHVIMVDQELGYVEKEGFTIPVGKESFIKDATTGNLTDGMVQIQLDTTVFYKVNGQLLSLGTIKKGAKVHIKKEVGKWYVIEIAGRLGFIAKKDTVLLKMNIVNPKVQNYTFDMMEKDLQEFENTYLSIVERVVIGKSVDGRNIYAIKLGIGKEEIFINAAHHAREHMTTNLVMEMLDQYANAYVHREKIDNYNVREILSKTSIWFVPMVNPDGVTLVQKGYKSAKDPSYVLKLNKGKTDFSAWKANIRGVDLNRQYPADWKNIRVNPGKPGPQNYKGSKPLSEPEAVALYNFTLKHKFKAAVAYHSSGQILYWYFHQDPTRMKRDLAIANQIKKKTGYSLVKSTPFPSGGGYTDWFIQHVKKPGFTPEISAYVGPRPVPLKEYDKIWIENHSIGLLLAK